MWPFTLQQKVKKKDHEEEDDDDDEKEDIKVTKKGENIGKSEAFGYGYVSSAEHACTQAER